MPMQYVYLGGSGLKVSKICVGCMSFGSKKWADWCIESDESIPIIRKAYESGINFFDTADIYSDGVSEEILGKAIKEIGMNREAIVVATKLFGPVGILDQGPKPGSMTHKERDETGYTNRYGLGRKHIFDAVKASLKRLDLEYIDLLQIHRFDHNVPAKETMKALHDVVESGMVRYIGASSMRTHELYELQTTARMNGWTEFIVMQNLYNAIYREEEREMMPTLKKFNMGCIPWSPLAMGYLSRPHAELSSTTRGSSMSSGHFGAGPSDVQINEKIAEIAKKRGVSMSIVATAYVLAKDFVTAPIIGMSKIERVDEAIAALDFELTEEELKSIDGLYKDRAIIFHD